MVADSFSRSSVSESSILRRLTTGLHNQIRGSPHNPSFWRLPFGAPLIVVDALPDVNGNVDSPSSLSASMKASTGNHSESCLANKWQNVKARAHSPHAPSIARTFDESLQHPDYDSALSDSSENASWRGRQRRPTPDAASDSECTCGRKKRPVRPPTSDHDDTATDMETDAGPDADTDDDDDDERRDFSFYFRSASASRVGNSMRACNGASDQERGRERLRRRLPAETASVLRNLTGSEAESEDSDHHSLFPVFPDSHPHASSEMHGPPNFLDVSEDGWVPSSSSSSSSVSRVAFPTVGSDGFDDQTADEYHDNDVHRVYFADPHPHAHSNMRNFLTATRRRVSSLSIPGRQRRPTLRSIASAKEELEKVEQARPRKDSSKVPLRKRLLSMRGWSSTVRGLELIPAISPQASFLGKAHTEGSAQRPNSLEEETRKHKKPGLLRRFFMHLGPGSKRGKEVGGASPSAFANQPPIPSSQVDTPRMALEIPSVVPPTGPVTWRRTEIEIVTEENSRSEWSETVEATRPSSEQRSTVPVGRGSPVLFRRLSLASPRTPGSGRQRSVFARV